MTGMNRNELLSSLIDLSSIGLEIGPGYNFLVPKSSGRRIETVDHAPAAELREKYRNEVNVNISRIEEVDYVSDGRPLAEIVNKPSHYDYIIASHVIEHRRTCSAFSRIVRRYSNKTGFWFSPFPTNGGVLTCSSRCRAPGWSYRRIWSGGLATLPGTSSTLSPTTGCGMVSPVEFRRGWATNVRP
jgi:hypothetical protein